MQRSLDYILDILLIYFKYIFTHFKVVIYYWLFLMLKLYNFKYLNDRVWLQYYIIKSNFNILMAIILKNFVLKAC